MPYSPNDEEHINENIARLLSSWYDDNNYNALYQAFKQFHDFYYKKAIMTMLGWSRGNESMSKDIIQDVFLRIYDKVSEKKGKRINCMQAYFFVALKTSFNTKNIRNKEYDEYDNDTPDNNSPPLKEFENRDEVNRIINDVNNYQGEEHAKILQMKFEGRSNIEIGEATSKSASYIGNIIMQIKGVIRPNRDMYE